ncbi:hypothetical protein CEXT_527091 [Caerostris extrusa]|uniref:Uncharacterized protein n=1 Tax=Caerostris extrusa TaxID=172846 RepID=A0AAV4XGF6_CAEEX|nr:hypothetical protein CEXT_527091 [Caerostris extrusa]
MPINPPDENGLNIGRFRKLTMHTFIADDVFSRKGHGFVRVTSQRTIRQTHVFKSRSSNEAEERKLYFKILYQILFFSPNSPLPPSNESNLWQVVVNWKSFVGEF